MKINKKGDIFNLTFLLIILFIVAVLALLFGVLTWSFYSAYHTTGIVQYDNSTADKAINKLQASTPNTTDMFVLIFFLGGTIGIVMGAVKTNYSSIMMFLFIMMLFLDLFVAAGFVNIYSGFAQSDIISSYSATQTFTNFIFSKYTPLIVWFLGLFIIIIMYGKSGDQIQ